MADDQSIDKLRIHNSATIHLGCYRECAISDTTVSTFIQIKFFYLVFHINQHQVIVACLCSYTSGHERTKMIPLFELVQVSLRNS